MSEQELKPCPHCGSPPVQASSDYHAAEAYLICCDSCETIGEFVTDQQEGINEWNNRPIEDALQKRLDEIAKLADQIDTHPNRIDLQETFDGNQQLVEKIERLATGEK